MIRRFCGKPALLLLLTVIAVGLTGCLGGTTPTGPGGTPTAAPATVSGNVKAPLGTPVAFFPVRPAWAEWLDPVAYALSEVPFAGAQITAISFATGLPVGGTATTDAQGHYTLTGIPAGTDVIIVATRTIGSQTVRLSALVTDPSGGSVVGEVNAASTLAAEAFALNLGTGQNLTASEVQPVLTQAQTAVAAMTTLDLTVGGQIIPATIGQGVTPGSVPGFNPTIPGVTIVDGDPKAMVQVIRENATAIDGSVAMEIQNESTDMMNNVMPSFDPLSTGLVELWWPADGIEEITRIEPGSYLAADATNAVASSPYVVNQWTSGTWTIDLGAGVTQVMTLTTGTLNWDASIKVTDTNRPDFEESVSVSIPRAFPTVGVNTASLSIAIKGLTSGPVTFTGTGQVTANSSSQPTSLVLTGDFTSLKLTAHGTMTAATFTDHPDLPKSFGFEGSVTKGTTYTGSFAVEGVQRTADPTSVSPSRVVFTGSYSSPAGAALDGRFELNVSNAADRDPNTGDSRSTPILGTVAFSGAVTVPQRPKVALSVNLSRQTYSAMHMVVGFRHDTKTVNGTVDWNVDTQTAKVALQNQDHLSVDLTLCTGPTRSASGTIKTYSGNTVGTFGYALAKGGYYVQYKDNSFESLY